jgi:WD40 repeat protein
MIYEKSEDAKNPYMKIAGLPQSEKKDRLDYPELMIGVMSSRIRCMTLSSTDDCIVFTTDNNQIMKVNVNVEKPMDDSKYEYLIYPFHSRAIQGMDVCIKKNLIATCSTDKTVRIWSNTNPPTLEICEQYNDEAYSVAFHPSGFHIIVGFTDRVKMMNVLQKSLKTFHPIPIKGCREIRFSNGGHLFACASQTNINVYKFYTGENNPEMIYKGHHGPVRCLNWFDDDSGFVSGGWDGIVLTWKLILDQNDKNESNPSQQYVIKNFNFNCVANKPDSKHIIFAAGQDKTIKMINMQPSGPKDSSNSYKDHKFDGKEIERYETGVNISQLQLLHGGRALFAGVSENDRPGSIQVIRFPFERIFEIQAHSLPIERIRISYDNSHLFSVG